jgi:hypothetical protein
MKFPFMICEHNARKVHVYGSFHIHFDAAKSTMVYHRLFRICLSSENAESPVFHNISVESVEIKDLIR